ncbi:hypothetical protein PsorP6_008383 [Peronosclerospora sorghi]|uniref:Uncharacterized protein n=1 Tax=Peronosclerospora sorghi TaxID=230839 RepID=A0ACC0WAH3_9STRA|nr:hypothetical protein PsorP6_008383 [Peronosclerospora sorghi]
MTTSSTVAALSSRPPQELPLAREHRLDAPARRTLPKITGRKLRMPRKFVVTDVPDDELDLLKPSGSHGALSEPTETNRDEDTEDNSNKSEDSVPSNSFIRKGKTQVRGRFTITDLSPESPKKMPSKVEDLSSSMGLAPSRAFEIPRRSTRRLVSRKPFQSAGDVRSSLGLKNSTFSQPLQQQEMPRFASFQLPGASSPPSGSMDASISPRPMSYQLSHCTNPTHSTFDNHVELLEKETVEMKNVLEKMVATNAQWIEALSSAGLMHARMNLGSNSEPVSPVEPPLECQLHEMQKAYTELQSKYDAVCQKNERMEIENAMLEIRLQQQVNRSTMLRSQLDKLTQYTEKLIGESSEPTLHDYNSDLTSIFGEQSEVNSPTAEDTTSGGEYGFNCDIDKSHRHRRRSLDEEFLSDSSTDKDVDSKSSSPSPYERESDDHGQLCDMDLTTSDLSSSVERDSPAALDLLLDDQVNQLRESLRSKDDAIADERESVIESLDSMAVCPSLTNFELTGHDEHDKSNHTSHCFSLANKLNAGAFLKPCTSMISLNYSTVSSTSSLAGYGLHLASIAQPKSSSYANLAATSLFGPHLEPCPNHSKQQHNSGDHAAVYNVLSPENLRFHDCQSLLEASEDRSSQRSSSQGGLPFTSSKAPAGADEVPRLAESTGNLFQRFVRRR